MKNLFFFAVVPVVALLAGCPIGPPAGEGEGSEGEGGEGEGASQIVAALDVTVPSTVDTTCSVFVTDTQLNYSTPSDFAQAIAGLTPVCTGKAAGEHCAVSKTSPTVADYFVAIDCGPDHLATDQPIHVTASGPYTTDWSKAGQCGLAPEGPYMSPDGTPVSVSTDFQELGLTPQIVISGDTIFPPYLTLVVTGSEYTGEGDAPGGAHVVVTGTISNNLCSFTYSEQDDGSQGLQTTLTSQDTTRCP
jgi:hypothetical protein